METMDQVSSNLEFIWMFKNSSAKDYFIAKQTSTRWHAVFSSFCKATRVGPRIKVVDNYLEKSMQKVASSLT